MAIRAKWIKMGGLIYLKCVRVSEASFPLLVIKEGIELG